jgi:hypothetical protein
MLLTLLSTEVRLSQRQATRIFEASPSVTQRKAGSAYDLASFEGWGAP